MEIQIRQATIQDLNVLMQWRMEVLHEVFSIPSERSVTELESENRRSIKQNCLRADILPALPT